MTRTVLGERKTPPRNSFASPFFARLILGLKNSIYIPFVGILELFDTNHTSGVDSWRRGVDSGGVHNQPPGYTLESNPR